MGRRLHGGISDYNVLHHAGKHAPGGSSAQIDFARGQLSAKSISVATWSVRDTDMSAAGSRVLARVFHPLQPTHLCLVALCCRHLPQCLVVLAQCHCLDEGKAFLE